MRTSNIVSACALAAGILFAGAAGSAPAAIGAAQQATAHGAAPASDSIHQLAFSLTDQTGREFKLADRRGSPTIVSMFYTSCQMVCPMLVEAIRATQQKLGEAERQRVNVLLVTIDPQHDTIAVLKKTADDRQLDKAWTLARTDAGNVRKLSAVLGVQYKALANGDFNHSTALILIDGDGRIAGRTNRLADADPAFVKLLKTTLALSSQP